MSTVRVPSNLDPYLFISFHMEREADSSDKGERAMLPFLLRVLDHSWTPPSLGHFVVNGRLGTVLTARGDRESVEQLLRDRKVHSIEASRPIGPTALECGFSVPDVKATKVHALNPSETGERAIVAIIDDGIDVLHEAFRDKSGKTRILCVWDQTDSSGTPPGGWTYGTLYTDQDINLHINGKAFPANSKLDDYTKVKPNQTVGEHGTLVASIAAGQKTGRGAQSDFAGGVAPGAKIIVVVPNTSVAQGNKQQMGYSKSHLDALQFIDQKAGSTPVVVNVSMGMNTGAHDGSTSLEVGYDEFTNGGLRPGRAIVKSAGNQTGRNGHAVLTLFSNQSGQFEWWSGHATRDEDLLELWFRACDVFEFRLHAPTGSQPTPWVTRVNSTESHVFGHTGNRVAMVFQQRCEDNGDSRLTIRVFPNQANGIETGVWRLEVRSAIVLQGGRIDAWLERHERGPTNFAGPQIEDKYTVTIPGTARTVITVGAVNQTRQAMSDSSWGPCRDGRPKPTITAPGSSISAAGKGTGTATDSRSGTSMAAPHVAGAVALLFSRRADQCAKDPSLRQWNAAQVEKALAHMSQSFTGTWNVDTGYGHLDAEAFILTFG